MIGSKLKEIREKTGMNKKEFAHYIGIKYTTYNNYETEAREPASDFLTLISKKFDVSIDYLLGLKEDSSIFHSYQLKSFEYEHIKKYRKLTPIGQQHVDAMLEWEAEHVEQLRQAKSPAAIIEFQSYSNENNRMVEYFRSASAGSGVFILGNEVAEQIAIPNTPENRAVDFAIKVSGDSMFPDYADGDIVLVSQKAELFHGDVGIFIINNNAYIKEYGEKELISRNPDAGNIQIAEYDNIVCMGKVIGKLNS